MIPATLCENCFYEALQVSFCIIIDIFWIFFVATVDKVLKIIISVSVLILSLWQ